MMSICIALLFFPAPLLADVYLYRVDVNVLPKISVKSLASVVESKSEGQPFYNTYVLNQPDTNYVLLKVTPKTGSDPGLEINPGVVLHQIQKLNEDGFIMPVMDNSKIYPTDKRWDLAVSSK